MALDNQLRNMSYIRSVVITATLTLILLPLMIGTLQHIALGAKPKFPNTKDGSYCSDLYNAISDLRKKSDKQGGLLTANETRLLDNLVATYNHDCRNSFGGNPGLTGQTGAVEQGSDVLKDDNPPAKTSDQNIAPGSGVNNPDSQNKIVQKNNG
jgi:hypothetical protein